jgi:GNAT superfamily N-acetyltransferase
MVSDARLAELHAFAEELGLPRRAFQGDHYDLDETLRSEALALGAAPVSGRELVTRLVEAGLRLQPAARRAAAATDVSAVMTVRPADPQADAPVLRRHLAGVPGGVRTWWAGWGPPPDVAVVADDGNRVGAAVCRAAGAVAVAVARPCRGRGIGTSLLVGLCEQAAAAGHEVLTVDVPRGNDALERATRAAGFTDGPDGLRVRRLR